MPVQKTCHHFIFEKAEGREISPWKGILGVETGTVLGLEGTLVVEVGTVMG